MEELLNEFLKELEELPQVIIDSLLRQTTDEDEKAVIESYAGALTSQFKELATYIRTNSARLSEQQRAETEQALRVSAGVSLVKGAKELASNLGSVTKKIGLASIIQEIKKIIKMILKAFGISLPKWLNILLLLIDEIIKWIISAGSPKLASVLSRMEQDYLAELTILEKLDRESQYMYSQEEDAN